MKIATFNINSVRARIDILAKWLKRESPDVVLLQEIKCQNKDFPELELKALGYHVIVNGQKSYNGVAILHKSTFTATNIKTELPTAIEKERHCFENDKNIWDINSDAQDRIDQMHTQSRYLEAIISSDDGKHKKIKVCCLYLPNGNPAFEGAQDKKQNTGVFSEKYIFKLQWMDRLYSHIKNNLIHHKIPLIVGGDFNVLLSADDCQNYDNWKNDALALNDTLNRWSSILNLGLIDVYKTLNPNSTKAYTFWDYQWASFKKNYGLRIDFFLANAFASDMLNKCWVDVKTREVDKSSDHTPLILEMKN